MSEPSFLACSNCHEVVIKNISDSVKVRNKVIVVRDNSIYAVCKGCDSEIQIPLVYDLDLAKSISKKDEPRLYIKTV